MTDSDSGLLDRLLRTVLASREDFEKVCEEHADRITPELAGRLAALAREAMRDGRLGLAQRAAMAASLIYLRKGQREPSLRSFFDYQQVLFAAAADLQSYRKAADGGRFVSKNALEIGARDLALDGCLLAADCAFFAGQIADPREQGDWIRECLQLLADSAQLLPDGLDAHLQRFTSLLASACRMAMQQFWLDDKAEIDALLAKLAEAADRWVPLRIEFREGPVKDLYVARSLASLSASHGSQDMAQRRLQAAIELAEGESDVAAWMEVVEQLYGVAATALSPRVRPGELRLLMKGRMEDLRGRFRTRAGRLWVAQELDGSFSEIVKDSLRHSESLETVFDFAESLKARLLLDLMQGLWTEPTAETAAETEPLEREILSFRQPPDGSEGQEELELGSLQAFGSGPREGSQAETLRKLEEIYTLRQAGFRAGAAPARLHEIEAALQPGELLLEFVIPYRWNHPAPELWAVAVSRRETRVIPLPIGSLPTGGFIGRMVIDGRAIDASPLGNAVFGLRAAIRAGRRDAERASLRLFHGLLIDPLLAAGIRPEDYRRWIAVPSGVLHHVPLAALEDGDGQALIERVALTTAPSASVWRQIQERPARPPTSYLALANPDLPGDYEPLDEAEGEVEESSALLAGVECRKHKGAEASEARLTREAPGAHLLHLATHGGSPGSDAIDFHRLLLAPADGHDGRVHAAELRRLDLSEARLVVLSICDGGLYRFGPGNEPYGLIAALLAAGAQNVMATLWPLEDKSGRRLVVEMFRRLRQDGPAEALRQACIACRDPWVGVRDWAAFTLVGPGRPFEA